MPWLLVHVEGQTEEKFVNDLLGEHLTQLGFRSVRAQLLGNPRRQRGGIRPWDAAKRDILAHLKEPGTATHAIIVDYYGMPADWPGRREAPEKQTPSAKAECVEAALLDDIVKAMGPRFDRRRFVPLVCMHEFEALLFSDPAKFAQEVGRPDLAGEWSRIRQEFKSPEEINDSVVTAPSKRILKSFPRYQKPLHGPLAARGIGLAAIRNECPHFNRWLQRLESLA